MAGSKSKLNIEVVAEQESEWTPEYPGQLPPLQMTPEQIARAEAEKAALLSTLPVEPRGGWRTPVESVVVVEEAPAVVAEHIVAPEPGALDAAKARVAQLLADQKFAAETLEIKQKAELAEALKEQGRLEEQTAVAIDAEAGNRLREAIASMQESKAGDAVLAARADAGTLRQEALRKRAAHAMGAAAQTRALLKLFDKEYDSQLQALRTMGRDDFLLGVPNVGRQAEMALGLYSDIQRALDSIQASRTSLDGMLDTASVRVHDGEVTGGYEKEILRLVEQVKSRWSQEDERNFVWCVTRLAKANPDAITHLQLLARGVTGRVAQLRSMQSEVNVEAIQFERAGSTLSPRMAVEQAIKDGDGARVGRPPRAADWSPFGELR